MGAAVSDPAFAIEVYGGEAAYASISATGTCTVGMLTDIATPTSATVLGTWDRDLQGALCQTTLRVLDHRVNNRSRVGYTEGTLR